MYTTRKMKNRRCSVLLGLFVVHLRCSSSLLAFGGSRSKYSARLGFVESAKNRRATLKQLQATRLPLPGLEFSSPGGEDGILSCQAAVAMGVDDLRVIDVEVGAPGPGEVRLKVVANALCHTDIYTLEGSDPEGLFPSILGHEAGAVVESVGKGVTSVVPGDKVVPCYTPQCREVSCIFCASPKTNLCPKIRATQGKGVMPDGTTRFRLANSKEPVHHFMGTSTFSEYTVVAEISCAKVSATANLETVCMLGCGVSTGWGAVWKTTNVEPSSSVAVFGLGAVGLAVIQAAKVRGATKIVAIDVNPGKFAAAEAMGATCTLDPTSLPEGTSVQNALASAPFDMPWGVDYTFDCTGNVAVMRSALECAHRGWGVSCVIGVAAAGHEISTRPFQLVTGRTWKGTAFGGFKSRDEVPLLVDRVMEGELPIDAYVTHRLNGVGSTMRAVEALHGGECLRAVVTY